MDPCRNYSTTRLYIKVHTMDRLLAVQPFQVRRVKFTQLNSMNPVFLFSVLMVQIHNIYHFFQIHVFFNCYPTSRKKNDTFLIGQNDTFLIGQVTKKKTLSHSCDIPVKKIRTTMFLI